MKRFTKFALALALGLTASVGLAACNNQNVTTPGDNEPPVSEVTYSYGLNKTSLNIKVGATEKLSVTVTPEKVVTPLFSSSAENVATVTEDGAVTAVSAGTATITVTVDGETLTCAVTVTNAETPEPPVTYSYSLNKTSTELEEGETDKLTVSVTPAKDISPEYKSSNEEVATVSEDGTVTAVSAGNATITVTVDGETLTCTVTVTNAETPEPPVIYSYSLNKTSTELEEGETDKLTVSVTPAKDISPEYESSNEEVATVSEDGTVIAVSAGNATITVTVDGETLTCTVTVTKVEIILPEIDTQSAVKSGISGETVSVNPTVNYSGEDECRTSIVVKKDGKDIMLSGSFKDGTLSFIPIGAGTYNVTVNADVDGLERVSENYDIEISSYGKFEQTQTEDGLTYTVTGALDKNAANTIAYFDKEAAGNTEIKFKLGNATLNWDNKAANPKPSLNSEFMAVMTVFERADGKFDLVALDFSKAKLHGATGNISEAANELLNGYISLRLYVGAQTPSVAFDDDGWEISPVEAHALGAADFILTAVQRRIIAVSDGNGVSFKSEYNVTFNHATANITNYTFDTKSDYTGSAKIALSTANTNVTIRKIEVTNPITASDSAVAGEVNLNALATLADGWTLESVSVAGVDGDIAVTDGKAELTAGTYYVKYTATSPLNNSNTQKTAVFTVTLNVE